MPEIDIPNICTYVGKTNYYYFEFNKNDISHKQQCNWSDKNKTQEQAYKDIIIKRNDFINKYLKTKEYLEKCFIIKHYVGKCYRIRYRQGNNNIDVKKKYGSRKTPEMALKEITEIQNKLIEQYLQ